MKTYIVKDIEAEPLQVIPADEIGETILAHYNRGGLEPWAWVSTGKSTGRFTYSEKDTETLLQDGLRNAVGRHQPNVFDVTVDKGDLREYTFHRGPLMIDVEAYTVNEAIEKINSHDFNEPIPGPGDLLRVNIELTEKFGIDDLYFIYCREKGEINLDLVKASMAKARIP